MAEHSIRYARPFCQAESGPLGCEGELDAVPSELSVDFVVVNVPEICFSALSQTLFFKPLSQDALVHVIFQVLLVKFGSFRILHILMIGFDL